MMSDEVMTIVTLGWQLQHFKEFNLSGRLFRIEKEEED